MFKQVKDVETIKGTVETSPAPARTDSSTIKLVCISCEAKLRVTVDAGSNGVIACPRCGKPVLFDTSEGTA